MKKILYYLLIAALMFPACEEPMNVKFNEEGTKKLTVEGSITTDTMSHRVMLSWSSDFFSR